MTGLERLNNNVSFAVDEGSRAARRSARSAFLPALAGTVLGAGPLVLQYAGQRTGIPVVDNFTDLDPALAQRAQWTAVQVGAQTLLATAQVRARGALVAGAAIAGAASWDASGDDNSVTDMLQWTGIGGGLAYGWTAGTGYGRRLLGAPGHKYRETKLHFKNGANRLKDSLKAARKKTRRMTASAKKNMPLPGTQKNKPWWGVEKDPQALAARARR